MFMKNFYVFVLMGMLLISILTQAQSPLGNLTNFKLSTGKGNAGLLDLEEDKQGNLVVVGFFSENLKVGENAYTCLNPQNVKYFYAKLNPNGDVLWLKEYPENTEAGYVAAEKIETDENNNIYVFGVYRGTARFGNQTLTNQGDNKEFLVKYNANGDLQWVKGFENGFYNNERDFITDEQGNSYLLGFRANVAKISTNGEEIFRKYLPSGFTPGALALWKDRIIIGTSVYGDRDITVEQRGKSPIKLPSIKAQEGYFYNTDALIASLDINSGEIIWAKMIRSNQGEEIKGLGVDNDGNISVLGTCSGKAQFGLENFESLPITGERENHSSVPFILNLNADGNLRWFKGLDIEESRKERGSYVISLNVDYQGNIFSTRAHCNENLWWGVYVESFDNNGKPLLYQTLGIENKKNNGFWKSSCGTANVFLHISKYNNKKYLFGEGRYLKSKDFDFNKNSNINIKAEWSNNTQFFIAQYGDGSKINLGTTTTNTNHTNNINNNSEIIVYTQVKYQGNSQRFKIGRYNMSQITVGNDAIQSIKIPEGLRVVLFENANFQGETFTLTQDAASLGNFNNQVSSLIVESSKSGNSNANNNNNNSNTNSSNNNTNPNNEISFVGCPTGKENVPAENEAFEKEVLRLTNIERAKAGLPNLTWNADLARAARYHAADMKADNYFQHATHDRINGELQETCPTFTRISKFGKGYAENIAMGGANPEEAVRMWMNSKGHRENIMGKYTSLGVGYYGFYWVQVFGE
jgi:uncharacterized protein YkwD